MNVLKDATYPTVGRTQWSLPPEIHAFCDPPLACGTHFQQVPYRESGGLPVEDQVIKGLKLSLWAPPFLLPPSWNSHTEERRLATWRRTGVCSQSHRDHEPHQHLREWTCKWIFPQLSLQRTLSLANTLITVWWEILVQRHLLTHRNQEKMNVCFFKLLSFGSTYTGVES